MAQETITNIVPLVMTSLSNDEVILEVHKSYNDGLLTIEEANNKLLLLGAKPLEEPTLKSVPATIADIEKQQLEELAESLFNRNERLALSQVRTIPQLEELLRKQQHIEETILIICEIMGIQIPGKEPDQWLTVKRGNAYTYQQFIQMAAYLRPVWNRVVASEQSLAERLKYTEKELEKASNSIKILNNRDEKLEEKYELEAKEKIAEAEKVLKINYGRFYAAEHELPYLIRHRKLANRYIGATNPAKIATFKRVKGFDNAVRFSSLLSAQQVMKKLSTREQVKNLNNFVVCRIELLFVKPKETTDGKPKRKK